MWNALEFFRIEALLRSKKVMEVYRRTYKKYTKTNRTTDKLFMDFAVHDGWNVLNGSHHQLISIEPIVIHHLFNCPACVSADLMRVIAGNPKTI